MKKEIFSICDVISPLPCDKKAMWLWELEPAIVSHYLAHVANFGTHRFSASGDNYLICQMTSQDLMIKGSRDFIGGSYDCCVTTLASLVTMCIVMLIFHVIHIPNCLNGHVTLWVETPQPKSLWC